MKHILSFQDWPDDNAPFGAFVFFMPGCDFNCDGCQNPELRNESDWNYSDAKSIIEVTPVRHIVFSGGDPFSKMNWQKTVKWANELVINGYNVSAYTGHDASFLVNLGVQRGLFSYIKCGQYRKELAQESGHFGTMFKLASTNQYIVDSNFNVISTNGVLYKESLNV